MRHKFFESYFYKEFNYNINFETNGSNEYFVKNHLNNNIDTNLSNNNSISIIFNKNISSQDNNISDSKLNKIIFTNESSENFLNSNKKYNNKNYEDKKESNNFSGYLNDTDGFNKLLNELKQEKIQEDKDFEKLQKQKQKNEYSNLWLSIEKKLDINTNDNNKSVNRFINEIEEKETKVKEKFAIEDDIVNTKIENNNNNKDNNNFLNKDNKENKNSLLDELKFESNFKKEINNKDNNIKQKNDIIKKPLDLGLNLNDYNSTNDLDNLINKDNNEDFTFENAKRLKPIIKNNRRGSAKKFLEESENKMKQNLNQNNLDNKEQISIGRRRIKYNFSNNVLPKINNEKKQIMKPPLIKNDFSFLDSNFNGNFFNNPKKDEINSYNAFNKRDLGYGNKISLTNNNLNLPLFLRDNKNDKFFEVKHNEQRNKPSFLLNKNIWDL